MGDLESVDGEYGDGGVDTEALEAGEESVGPHEEGDDVGEGGHADRHPGVTHCLAEQVGQAGALTWRGFCKYWGGFDRTQKGK